MFEWRMTFNSRIPWVCIGVIEDKRDMIEKNKTNNSYARLDPICGCFLLNTNGVMYPNLNKYCDIFHDKGTVVTMTLNKDKHQIYYKINGKEFGIAHNELNGDRYRLAVTLGGEPNEGIELI